MRAFVPEISWHNRLPALSLDIAKSTGGNGNQWRVATGGNDCRVYIWQIKSTNSNPDITIRAGLRRHHKSVGAVKFSSSADMLASGDDEGYIYIWKHNRDREDDLHRRQESLESNGFLNDDGFEDLELWQQHKGLRGHIEDVCDLCWSKDEQFLLSGSVDNSAILWDTQKGTKLWCSDLIKGYVQGVAIDPHSQYMAAISSDRALRIYNFQDRRLLYATRRMNIKGKYRAFFCDDTVKTFCRRFEFSPDGQFLLAPTSRMIEREQKASATSDPSKANQQSETEQSNELAKSPDQIATGTVDNSCEVNQRGDGIQGEKSESIKQTTEKQPKKPTHVLLVFKRPSFNKPTHYYPTGEVSLCARFSPVVYQLKDGESNFWGLPYRLVFAVATTRSVIIYDSQQTIPIGYISQIHLARITDLAWSHDGHILMITSYDGYSTIVTFDGCEFGEIYTGPMIEPVTESSATEEISNGDNPDEKPAKKGQKRMKPPREPIPSKKEKLDPENDLKSEEEKDMTPKRVTPKKITPTRLPESATLWRFLTKKS